MALAGALASGTNVVAGFTNRSLRTQVAALLGCPYSQARPVTTCAGSGSSA